MYSINKWIFSKYFIRKEAEVEMEGSFLVRLIYDDEITYNLIEAAEKVLSMQIKNINQIYFCISHLISC